MSRVATLILGLALGFLIGGGTADRLAREAAVEQSCGYYDAKTGKFAWGKPPYVPGITDEEARDE